MSRKVGGHTRPIMDQLPLFVYGSLRQGESNHHYLAGRFDRLLPATLQGFRRGIGAHGFPVIGACGGESVAGELYFIRPGLYAETLQGCDELEEIPPGATAGALYRREPVIVATSAGSLAAWVYIGQQRWAGAVG